MQEHYEKQIQEVVIKNQSSIEDGATVVSTGYVASNDTPEESYVSIFYWGCKQILESPWLNL